MGNSVAREAEKYLLINVFIYLFKSVFIKQSSTCSFNILTVLVNFLYFLCKLLQLDHDITHPTRTNTHHATRTRNATQHATHKWTQHAPHIKSEREEVEAWAMSEERRV